MSVHSPSPNVSRETAAHLATYQALLTQWGQRLNLVAKTELARDSLADHIADSLSLLQFLPPGLDRFIDMGSGGGLPAIPLAIAAGCHVDLIESDRRKAAFLQTALAKLDLRGTVWRERIETAQVPPALCITARALAALDALLALAHPLLAPGGRALFLKGPQAQDEIEIARRTWHMKVETFDGFHARSHILKITDLRPIHAPGSEP